MKLSISTLIFVFVLSLTSCVVPKKKYDALETEKNQLIRQLASSNARIDTLNKDIDDLDDIIAGLEADTADYSERLSKAMAQLATLTKNYSQLRANSSEEMKKLIGKLEAKQTDLDQARLAVAEREQKLSELETMLSSRNDNLQKLKDKLEDALLGFTKKGLTVEMRDGKVYVSLTDKLLFASGSINIDARGKEALAELAKVLNEQEDLTIMVEGHTDDVPITNLGDIKDNWDLSVMRATSVVRFLTEEHGVDAKKVVASGRGEFFPVLEGKTTDVRSKNRRIEVVLIPELDKLYQLIQN